MKRKRITNERELPNSKRHKPATLLSSILSLYTSTSSTIIAKSQVKGIVIKNSKITGIFINPSVTAYIKVNAPNQISEIDCSCGSESEFWCSHVKTIVMVYDGQIEMGEKVLDLDKFRKKIEMMDEQLLKVMLMKMIDERNVEDFVEVMRFMNKEMNKEENDGITIEKYEEMKKKEALSFVNLSSFLPIIISNSSNELKNNESYIDKEKFVENLSKIISNFFQGVDDEYKQICEGSFDCDCHCHSEFGGYTHEFDEGCDECNRVISYNGYVFDPIEEYMLKTIRFIIKLANGKHFYNAFDLLDKILCEFLNHDYSSIDYGDSDEFDIDSHYDDGKYDNVDDLYNKQIKMFKYINYLLVMLSLSHDLPGDIVQSIEKNIEYWISKNSLIGRYIEIAKSSLSEKKEMFEKIITNQIHNDDDRINSDKKLYKLKLKRILNRDGLSIDVKITQIYYCCTYYRINFIKNLCEIYFKKYEAPIRAIENGEVTDLKEILALLMLIFYSTHTENLVQCFEFIVSCIDTLPNLENPFVDEDVMVDEDEEVDNDVQNLSNINNSIISIIIQINNISQQDFLERMIIVGLSFFETNKPDDTGNANNNSDVVNTILFVSHLIFLSEEKPLDEKQNLVNGLFNYLKTWNGYSKLLDYLIGKDFDEKHFSFRLSQLLTIHISGAINNYKDFDTVLMRQVFQKIALLKDKSNELVFVKNLLQYFHLEKATCLYDDLNIVNFSDSRTDDEQKKISSYLYNKNNIKNFRFLLDYSKNNLLPKHYIHVYRFIIIVLLEKNVDVTFSTHLWSRRTSKVRKKDYNDFLFDVSKIMLCDALLLCDDDDDEGKRVFEKILEFYNERLLSLKDSHLSILKHFIKFVTANVVKIGKDVLDKIGKKCEGFVRKQLFSESSSIVNIQSRSNSSESMEIIEFNTLLLDLAKAIGNKEIEILFKLQHIEKDITMDSFLEFKNNFPNHVVDLIKLMKENDMAALKSTISNYNSAYTDYMMNIAQRKDRMEIYIHLKDYDVVVEYLSKSTKNMMDIFSFLDKHNIPKEKFDKIFFPIFLKKMKDVFPGFCSINASTIVYLIKSRHRQDIIRVVNQLERSQFKKCKCQNYKNYENWITFNKYIYGALNKPKKVWDKYVNIYIRYYCSTSAKWRKEFKSFLEKERNDYPPVLPNVPQHHQTIVKPKKVVQTQPNKPKEMNQSSSGTQRVVQMTNRTFQAQAQGQAMQPIIRNRMNGVQPVTQKRVQMPNRPQDPRQFAQHVNNSAVLYPVNQRRMDNRRQAPRQVYYTNRQLPQQGRGFIPNRNLGYSSPSGYYPNSVPRGPILYGSQPINYRQNVANRQFPVHQMMNRQIMPPQNVINYQQNYHRNPPIQRNVNYNRIPTQTNPNVIVVDDHSDASDSD